VKYVTTVLTALSWLVVMRQGDTEHIRVAIDAKQAELEPWSEKLSKEKAHVDTLRTEVSLLQDRVNSGDREAEQLSRLHEEVRGTTSTSTCPCTCAYASTSAASTSTFTSRVNQQCHKSRRLVRCLRACPSAVVSQATAEREGASSAVARLQKEHRDATQQLEHARRQLDESGADEARAQEHVSAHPAVITAAGGPSCGPFMTSSGHRLNPLPLSFALTLRFITHSLMIVALPDAF
jgi:hypothetical protein